MFKKLFTQPQFIGVILIGLYLFTRVYHLLLLPIFEDEAIYIYWAKVVATTHSQWFISLVDGKPPLLVWAIGMLLTILPSQWYLLAGRLPSVVAGLFSVCAMYGIGKELFQSKRAGVISAFLYIIFPFTLLYDRMALFDALLSSMLLCSTYFMIRTSQTLSYKYAALWGFFLGLAFLSKPTALFFIILLPLSFLLLTKFEIIMRDWKRILFLLITSIGVAEVINNLQRVSHVFASAAIKNAQFQQPISELIKSPFALTLGNLNGFFSWMEGYYTLGFFAVVLFSFIAVLSLNWRKGLVLSLLWFVPVFILASVGREIFPRYILFVTPYSLLALSGWVDQVWSLKKTPVLLVILSLLVLVPLVKVDYYLLTNPVKAQIPSNDYQQFVSDSPSGYGVSGVINFLNQEKTKHPIVLVTQGTFGLYPYAFTLEYWNDPQVTIVPRWPLTVIDQDLLDMAKDKPVYVLLKQYQDVPPGLPLMLVLRSEKPSKKYPLLLTKIILPPQASGLTIKK